MRLISIFLSRYFFPSPSRSARTGFSLFEIVFVMAIFSIILFALVSVKGNVDVLKNLVNQKLLSRQDIEQTFQIMVTNIRSAGPSSLGAYPIEAASTSSFTFYANVDTDNLFERVTYALSSSTLTKTIVKPTGNPLVYATSSAITTAVANYITIPSSTSLFAYFGSSSTSTSGTTLPSPVDPTLIRAVRVTLYADINPGSAPKPILFTDTVTIRNLHDN